MAHDCDDEDLVHEDSYATDEEDDEEDWSMFDDFILHIDPDEEGEEDVDQL